MIELVGSTNRDGYWQALSAAFDCKDGASNAPVKSAFCKKRKEISFRFFRDPFLKMLTDFEPHRATYNGMRVYGIDGFQLHLPRTKDIVENGFTGRATSKYRESWTPRMYLVHAYDVLSGVSKDIRYSNRLHEQQDAEEMVLGMEQNSVCLYDRLYICSRLIKAHKKAKNYYIMRGRDSLGVIKQFRSSEKERLRTRICQEQTWLIKVKNEKTGETDVFATNLPRSWINRKTIQGLYMQRWEVEDSFRQLTETHRIEQWHSKFFNGIQQELYASLWFLNFCKIEIHKKQKIEPEPRNWTYQKPNFKFIRWWILRKFQKILKRIPGVLNAIGDLIKKSTANRKHYSRSYPRQIRGPASPFPYRNTEWVWDC
jgi:Transposase DDE domain